MVIADFKGNVGSRCDMVVRYVKILDQEPNRRDLGAFHELDRYSESIGIEWKMIKADSVPGRIPGESGWLSTNH